MAQLRSIITGVGHYLPARVVPNCEFEDFLDTTDEWITTRTGIRTRHFAAKGETASDMAIAAAREALQDSGTDANDIDGIVLATSTPDNTFPSTATAVQAGLGISGGFAFDVQAVCAGFIYALVNANALLTAGEARRILVIGTETFSRILDMTDRGTCILFGDGAGAIVLEAVNSDGNPNERGILASKIRSNGKYRDLLYVDGGVSTTQTAGHLRMNGREVFRHAVDKLTGAATEALGDLGLTPQDVDVVIPHQANQRIIAATTKKLGISDKRVVTTVDRHGNTSAASIPLAFHAAKSEGMVKEGDIVLTKAIGGGLTWGAVVLRW